MSKSSEGILLRLNEVHGLSREQMKQLTDICLEEGDEVVAEIEFKEGFLTGWDMSRQMLGHYVDSEEAYDIYMRGRRRIKS